MKTLWPYVNKAVLKLLKDEVEPTLQAQLPMGLNTLKITSFHLGDDAPVLGPISAYRKDKQDLKGFEIDIFISWRPKCDITFSVMKMKLGLKSLVIEGSVSLVFRPLLEQMPVIGGFQLFMINPPVVDVNFSGAANIVDFPVLAGTIRNIINGAICDSLVLPNRIFIPVADEADMDMPRLSFPRPEAVLRFRLYSGKALLAKDFNFWGAATSDPYAVVKVGARSFRTKTVKRTVNPTWQLGQASYDFFMFNKRQLLNIDLFDEDIDSDDKLGKVRIAVGDAVMRGIFPLSLVQENGETEGGEIEIGLETHKLVEVNRYSELPEPMMNLPPPYPTDPTGGTAVGMIQIRCRALRGVPKKYDKTKTTVSFEVLDDPACLKDVKQSGGGHAKTVPALVNDAVPHEMQAMIENLSIGNDHVHPMSVQNLASFAHYPPEIIFDILKRKPSFDTVFNYGCTFLLAKPRDATLKIKVYVGGKKRPYATGEISAAQLLSPEYANLVQLKRGGSDSQAGGLVGGAVAVASTAAKKVGGVVVTAIRAGARVAGVLSPRRRSAPETPGSEAGNLLGPPSSATTSNPPSPITVAPSPIAAAAGAAKGAVSGTLSELAHLPQKIGGEDSLSKAWDERHSTVDMQLEFTMFKLEKVHDAEELREFFEEDISGSSSTSSGDSGERHAHRGLAGLFGLRGLLGQGDGKRRGSKDASGQGNSSASPVPGNSASSATAFSYVVTPSSPSKSNAV
ncbi:unnamed protein product [Amoebophrya sp. A25]|nr:unnamed protein product [Amoebophrya sp. A25]|eukprot:GSA25T00026369001.1